MLDLPPRMAAEMARAKATGCRAIAVWNEDIGALADRAERAEAKAAALDAVCHDMMFIIISQAKVIETASSVAGAKLRVDANAAFERWAAVGEGEGSQS